jgi:DNA mismatch repair protein MutS
MFRPSECISTSQISMDEVKAQIVDGVFFSRDVAENVLQSQFGQDWAERFRLEDRDLSIRACGAALGYLHSTHLDALGHVTGIRLYSGSEFMVLDEVTLRNLELLRNVRDRSKRGTLREVLDKTKTPMGSRTLARWMEMPSVSKEEISRRLEAVEELSIDPVLRGTLIEALDCAGDVERLMGRISTGCANPKDLTAIRCALERLPCIFMALEGARSGELQDIRSLLDPGPLAEAVTLISKAIEDDPPSNIRDGGAIRDGFSQELDSLRSIIRDGKAWISRLENLERKNTGIKSLKIGYTNVFGYYIEVSRPNLYLVPKEYQRKQTMSNAERFVTPELKEMESKVLSAQERSKSLEQDLFAQVRLDMTGYSSKIQARASALGKLDVLCSFAMAALEGSYVKPEFNSEAKIVLRDARHPVLDAVLRGSFVPNDVFLDSDKNRLVILTGPNMAGKSTFMRQIALVAVMAQMGSFVPASFASLCIMDRIFTRVGAYDDLRSGQSTFMVEMMELANILRNATRESLILLDEVGRGTSTFDGLSIAWAITEYLHNSVGAKTVFATHYHQLTQLEGILYGVKNCNIAVKEEGGTITFLRTVVPGATDRSYGVHVAKLAGVPEPVVRRAGEVLKEIEMQAEIEPEKGRRKKLPSKRYTQLIFFDGQKESSSKDETEETDSDKPDPLLDEIMRLDLDSLTPREALNKLADYQKMLREKNGQD